MRRVWQVGMATVAASAALAGGAAFATGDGGGSHAGKAGHREHMVLIEQIVDAQFVNVGDAAAGPGDYNVFRYDVFAEGKKRVKVGDTYVICVAQFPPAGFQCESVTQLDGRGEFMLSGVSKADISADFTMAVTGGTGDFRNARGEVTVELVSQEPFVQRATFDFIGVR